MSVLNLSAIHSALRELQRVFPRINVDLLERRDQLDDEVIANMMDGYRVVDGYLSDGVDIFSLGNSSSWLKLNATVLCGTDPARLARHHRLLEATSERFYGEAAAGIGDVMGWYVMHRKQDVWRRAAGVYNRILSEPQLFIEGNHRTGALIMSFILASEEKPPFVLTKENAKGYFNPSSLIKRNRKKSLVGEVKLGRLTKEFEKFLRAQKNPEFLGPSVMPAVGE